MYTIYLTQKKSLQSVIYFCGIGLELDAENITILKLSNKTVPYTPHVL